MKLFLSSIWIVAIVGCVQLLGLVSARSADTNKAVLVSALRTPPAVPAEPVLKTPIDFFRELLALNSIERNKVLADRTPEDRRRILAKVREYESLKPDQRELRLQATELRWCLLPLLSTPATNRGDRLSIIPERDRKLVEDRLQQWDKLAPNVQKQLLDHEATIRYFTELGEATSTNVSAARREKLQQGIAQWQQLSEDQRRGVVKRFYQFFELTAQEKERALNTLSEPERQQIERTLRSFGSLTPGQRAQCVRSFEKFTSMSLAERNQFLKNADRWKLMSPAERQAWRDLVNQIPMLPPDIDVRAPPRRLKPVPLAPAIVTNAN